MATIDVRRTTDTHAAQQPDALFCEYVAWVGEQLATRHGFPIPGAQQEQVNAAFRDEWPKLFGPRGRMYLALVDERPAGVAALKPITDADVELKRVFVRPQYRGLGVARRLVEQAVADAGALGYRNMQLETFDFMEPAHALYRSLGFVDGPPFAGFEGEGHGVAAFELFMYLDLEKA